MGEKGNREPTAKDSTPVSAHGEDALPPPSAALTQLLAQLNSAGDSPYDVMGRCAGTRSETAPTPRRTTTSLERPSEVPTHRLGTQRMIVNPAWFPFEDRVRRKIRSLNDARGGCREQESDPNSSDEYFRTGGPAMRDYKLELSGEGGSGPRPPKFLPLAEIGTRYFHEGAAVCADGTPVLRQNGFETACCMSRRSSAEFDDNMHMAHGSVLEIDERLNCKVNLSVCAIYLTEEGDEAQDTQDWVGWLHASLLLPPFCMDMCVHDCYQDREEEPRQGELFEVGEGDVHLLSSSDWVFCEYPKVVVEALAVQAIEETVEAFATALDERPDDGAALETARAQLAGALSLSRRAAKVALGGATSDIDGVRRAQLEDALMRLLRRGDAPAVQVVGLSVAAELNGRRGVARPDLGGAGPGRVAVVLSPLRAAAAAGGDGDKRKRVAVKLVNLRPVAPDEAVGV